MKLSRQEWSAIEALWRCLKLDHTPQKADCIVGFGNYNCDIPARAAELYRQGYAPWVLFTGGAGRNTAGILKQTEAELFASVALREGVPADRILLDTEAANTADNLRNTKRILAEKGLPADTILGVHQPFMERRIFAAAGVTWPELKLIVTSPQVDIPTFFEHAERDGTSTQTVIEELVGDYQRMDLYARKGWQTPQPLSEEAEQAFAFLVSAGYDGQLAR